MIITTMAKCRDRSRAHATTNNELFVTLNKGLKPLTNIKKGSISDVVWFLYAPLRWLIYHLA